MSLYKIEGLARTLREIDRFGRQTGRSTNKTMLEVASLVCSKLMRNTQPWGVTAKSKAIGEQAVKSDILGVMTGAGEGLITWVESKSGEGVVLPDGTVIDWENYTTLVSDIEQIYRQKRKKGRIVQRFPNQYIPGELWEENGRVVVPMESLRKFIEDRQAAVGIAKSVWWNASKHLKGVKTISAPAWIRRHGGTGDARIQVFPMGLVITLKDGVGYLRDSRVLNPQHIYSALRTALAGKIRQLKKSIEYHANKSR